MYNSQRVPVDEVFANDIHIESLPPEFLSWRGATVSVSTGIAPSTKQRIVCVSQHLVSPPEKWTLS